MAGVPGYYSIIQYCPDASRGEAANVGVVLFCPDRHFLEVRISEGNDRIARFFGRNSFDPERINSAKQAIANRLHIERDRFRTLEDLQHFVDTRANDVILTSPRPMKVIDLEKELEELFHDLVGGRPGRLPSARGRLGAELKSLFNRHDLRDKIRRNTKVQIPITGTLLEAPYAFKNGVWNLVRPLPMSARTLAEARKLAIDGDLLNKHAQEMREPAKLLIAIAKPETKERETERRVVEKLLNDYELTFYREEQLDKLEEYVERSACLI